MEIIPCLLQKGERGLSETQMSCPSEFSICNSLKKMNWDGDLAQQGHAPCYKWKSTASETADWEMDL